MGFFKWFGNSPKKKAHTPSVPRGVAYARWSCLSESPNCKAQSDVVWIPGLADPPKPRGCRCDLAYTFATERGAPELAAFIRRHGGIATVSAWEASEENPAAAQRRVRAQLDAVVETEAAARRSEKEDPARAAELYREAIAGFTRIASEGDEWTWRRLPPCYNRLSMVLERLHRPGEALDAIREFYGVEAPMCPTRADAEVIAKRRDRVSKAGRSAESSG